MPSGFQNRNNNINNDSSNDRLSKKQRNPPTLVPIEELENAEHKLKEANKTCETLVSKLKQGQESAALWEKRAKYERQRKEYYKRQLADTVNTPRFHFTIPQEWRVFRTSAELAKYLRPQLRKYGKDAKEEWIIEWCRELHRLGMITKDTVKDFL